MQIYDFSVSFLRKQSYFCQYMIGQVKKRQKVSSSSSPRKTHIGCVLSDEEARFVEGYLKKYRITNRSRWFRETILASIMKSLDEDYPTLFDEHDMRR